VSYRTVRPLLYRLEPERAHHLVMTGLGLASRNAGALAALRALHDVRDPRLEVRAFGLVFPNPLGLAAGLDEDAVAVPASRPCRSRGTPRPDSSGSSPTRRW